MRLALVADTFPPIRNSGAVQLRDLAREFTRQGHFLTVILPSPDQKDPWIFEQFEGIELLRLSAPRTKDIGYVLRTLAELIMPFAMLRNYRKSPLALERWDGVVWYAPSIFHGPFVSALKNLSACRSYLIIRDIFPEWAADMGLMSRRNIPYRFFDAVARYQYSIADLIGVQSPGNQKYFDQWLKQPGRKLEVLQNWLDRPGQIRCSIRIDQTALASCKVFVYAGNMGVAQGIDILLHLAEKLCNRKDIGFLFVGRGSEVPRLRAEAQVRQLNNVIFFDEIDPDEIPDLYTQCSAGIVALDPRHKSHNIPGKFLTYMQSGLPVLGKVNPGSDLALVIQNERVGQVCETNNLDDLLIKIEMLINQIEIDSGLSARCTALFEREFTVEKTVKQIVASLSANQ